MKVNSNITSFYNSKYLKKGLEFAANNGALFSAGTIFALSLGVRPAVILLTPNTDKENKKIACAKSIASSGVGYLLTYCTSLPLARSIKKIDDKPQNFLKPDTIKNFKNGAEKLTQSRSYKLATQMFKLGLSFGIAAPKALLTCTTLPLVMNTLFKKDSDSKNITFRGNDRLTNSIGKMLDKKGFQKFAEKYKDSNYPMHIVTATDALATTTFIGAVNKNDKIKQERKKALMYNAGISTALSIASSYILDSLTDKQTDRFIKKFKEANKFDQKLDKQVEGIKIAKPILLMGGVYYILIPLISTFLADRGANLRKEDKYENNGFSRK